MIPTSKTSQLTLPENKPQNQQTTNHTEILLVPASASSYPKCHLPINSHMMYLQDENPNACEPDLGTSYPGCTLTYH